MVNFSLVKYVVTIGSFHLPIVERNPINTLLRLFQNQAQFPLVIMRTGTSDKWLSKDTDFKCLIKKKQASKKNLSSWKILKSVHSHSC